MANKSLKQGGSKNSKKEAIPEIRKVVCRGCGGELDDVGCSYTCKYDTVNFAERNPKMIEVNVYVLVRTEPYIPKGKPK